MNNRIEEIRKSRGIRQEEFAHKIARYFDMTIEEVFLFDEEEAV